jgi:hypothetical protein
VEVERKLLPLRVSVCAPAPATTEEGERLVSVGAGLLTAKVALEVPPPGVGFVTTTAYLPAVAWSATLRVIVNSLALTKVGVCATPL